MNREMNFLITQSDVDDGCAKQKDIGKRIYDSKDMFFNMKVEETGKKYDGDKLLPAILMKDLNLAVSEVVKVLTEGAKKYERDNWRKVEPFLDRYENAMYRHLLQWSGGEMIDDDIKTHHLANIITNALFLLQMEMENKEHT